MKGFKQTFGSPLQVFNGTAKKTKGGLTKKDFKKTKRGSIVSKKKSKLGSKPNNFMRLKEKARKSGAPMFEYNGKKYFKNKSMKKHKFHKKSGKKHKKSGKK